MVNVVLGKRNHSEYGVVTVPFPIPREQYDQIIEMLQALEIGDALNRDCWMEEISGDYPILKRLEATEINVDEMDYLIKRLESFDQYELLQYQASAVSNGLSDMTDLINLTYCCQKVTVIQDFRNLEQIGKRHVLTISGGCSIHEKLATYDFRKEALALILNCDGKVTPYGVVYQNGMELDEVYKGRDFPAYQYDDFAVEVGVYDTGMTERSEDRTWLYFPMSKTGMERMLERSGFINPEKIRIASLSDSLLPHIEDYVDPSRESLDGINGMAYAISELNTKEREKFKAATEFVTPNGANQLENLALQIDLFDFYPDITTPEEYGRHVIAESRSFDSATGLDDFFDYKRFGEWKAQNEMGGFTANGYIVYCGVISIPELLAGVLSERLKEKEEILFGGIQL
ncbi:hypothetical protein [Anaerotruncus rubiinfantis]|uniref:hypothetical protein n=1 Tax=Anaerotruncus rubiinfantis TaxID=1720200 RepID=UPI0008346670|nr:hypothetical protein [Anaerotruncus rubiinfantis]